MSHRLSNSQAANEAVLPASNPIDDVSQDLSYFSLSPRVGADVDALRLWFLPEVIPLPRRVQRGASHARNKTHTGDNIKPHVPKLRNVFMRFKSFFVAQKIFPGHISFVEDSCQVSTIAGYVWQALPESDKALFRQHEGEEQRAHQLRHPEYELKPGKAKKVSTTKSRRNEIDMKPEKHACKEIAELVLRNLRGEELAIEIRKVLKATLPVDWKKVSKGPKPSSETLARDMKKSAKKSRLPSKGRSSLSKAKQSKASLDSTHAGLVDCRRSRAAVRYSEEVSDDEDEEVSSDDDVEHKASECSMPPRSLTSQDCTLASTAQISTPSRLYSPETFEDSLDSRLDLATHQPAFDSASLFAPFQHDYTPTSNELPYYASFSGAFPNGIHANHTVRYSDRGVEEYSAAEVYYLVQDNAETPKTIDPCLLHI